MQITINRPEKRNAFRPETVGEIMRCMTDARDDPDIGVIILTGTFTLHPASLLTHKHPPTHGADAACNLTVHQKEPFGSTESIIACLIFL